MPCLSEDDALAIARGGTAARDRHEAHLDTCSDCRELVSLLVASGDDAPAADVPRFFPGQTIGRFVLRRPIGVGGMGVIFEASDPMLERRVALKLLRVDGGTDPEAARERMLRESRALARLNHPNVVTLYDVGVHAGEIYLAMELVDGQTLADWIATPRRLGEVLDALVQAGRGLAAAHAAGLIHRDVKPANILIGADGRVRLGDFGVVRTDEPASRQSGVVGTPSYMAPEVRAGRSATALSDQWSFAATLSEAVGAAAPRWLRRVIERGLADDPAARYRTLGELLSALRARTRRAIALAGTAALVGFVAVTAVIVSRTDRDACDVTLADTWGLAQRSDLAQAFGAGEQPAASLLAAAAASAFDRHAEAWRALHAEVCHAHGAQAAPQLACLDRDLVRLRATVDRVSHAPRDRLVAAADTALDLPAVDECRDVDKLFRIAQLPEDPDRRRQLLALEAELDTAAAQFRISEQPAVLAIAGRAVAAAGDYAPLRARALQLTAVLERARLDPALPETLHRALAAAEEAGDVVMQAQLAVSLLDSVPVVPVDRKQRAWFVDDAASRIASIARTSPETAQNLRYHWLGARANAALLDEDAPAAIASMREALVIGDRLFGAQTVRQARLRGGLAVALIKDGQFRGAVTETAASLPVLEHLLAPDHPELAAAYVQAGGAYHFAGDENRALGYARRASRSPRITSMLRAAAIELCADVELAQRAYAAAAADLEQAIALADADHRDATRERNRLACAQRAAAATTAQAALGAAQCLVADRRPQAAVPLLEAAIGARAEDKLDLDEVRLRFLLAQELGERGHDGDAVRAIAEGKRARLDAGKLPAARGLAREIDRWITDAEAP